MSPLQNEHENDAQANVNECAREREREREKERWNAFAHRKVLPKLVTLKQRCAPSPSAQCAFFFCPNCAESEKYRKNKKLLESLC